MKDIEHHDKMGPMSRPTTRLALNALIALLATCVVHAADLQGNADKGKELFTANGCTACHSVTSQDAAKLGPLLVGVVGRKAGNLGGSGFYTAFRVGVVPPSSAANAPRPPVFTCAP